MKNILITGAEGFIGKNLVSELSRIVGLELFKYDKDNTFSELEEYIQKADFIFHLAGINRPKEDKEFDSGNRGFTEQILSLMDKHDRKVPILITSSTQSTLENLYGISKRKAEVAVLNWGRENNVKVYVFRLPNVFGKWCRPNYNSVVATFCHNIARNIPIQINDTEAELNLVYIDAVVKQLIDAMKGKIEPDIDGFCSIPRVFKVKLGILVYKLYSFKNNRESLVMPSLESDFDKFLYSTYLSYLEDNNFAYDLKMKHDERGFLAEFIKSKSFGQIFISKTKPGITRGNHWHHTKVEKFLVVEGEAVIRFRHIESNEVIEYKVSGRELKVVDIPVGYTHSITNIGETELTTLFWAHEIFEPAKPDTYFVEV